ncbi:MAG: ABC transporter permease [Ruminococcus sp.]|nr:ABC transporter permease [Ruminococcus sp.]
MKFINLLKKELSELINLQMILGLVVALGIFMVLGGIMDTTIDEAKEETTNVTIRLCDRDNTEYTKSLIESIKKDGNKVKIFETSGSDYAAILDENDIKDLIIIPEGFTAALEKSERPEIITVSRMKSAATLSNLNVGTSSGLSIIKDKIAADVASRNGMSAQDYSIIETPVQVRENTVVDDKSAEIAPGDIMSKIALQNSIMPLIVFVLIIMTSQMLMSAVANEKTDKTLETLLSAPVSRGAVIGAKMLAAAIIALINAGVYMFGFTFFVSGATDTVADAAKELVESSLSVDEAISKLGLTLGGLDYFLVGLQLFFTIMICLSVSLILGALVNDSKNTQNMIMPIMMLAMIPYMISVLADINGLPAVFRYIVYAIPFTHTFSAIPNLMFGNRTLFFAGLIYQMIVFAICMFFALRLFMSDKIFTISLNFGQKSKYKSRKRKAEKAAASKKEE